MIAEMDHHQEKQEKEMSVSQAMSISIDFTKDTRIGEIKDCRFNDEYFTHIGNCENDILVTTTDIKTGRYGRCSFRTNSACLFREGAQGANYTFRISIFWMKTRCLSSFHPHSLHVKRKNGWKHYEGIRRP